MITTKPSKDYDTLVKQFYSLRTFANNLLKEKMYIMKTWYNKSQVQNLHDLLESERKVNETLTNEIEKLEKIIEEYNDGN